MLGIVIGVANEQFWYKACTHCFSKSQEENRECEKCGCTSTMLQYRLCLEVETQNGLLSITVFGHTLGHFFGSTAEKLSQTLQSSSRDQKASKAVFHTAVEDCFIGFTFELHLKNLKRTQLDKSGDISFVATEIKRCGSHQVMTVLERFEELFRSKKSDIAATPLKCNPFLIPSQDTPASSRSNENPAETSKLRARHRRTLSDTNLFLEDSFVIQLMQRRNVSSSQNRSSALAGRKTSITLEDDALWNRSLTLSRCKDRDGEFSHTSQPYCDILDEVTLPLISPMPKCGSKRKLELSLKSEQTPKLRRSRSLCANGAFDLPRNALYLTQESANDFTVETGNLSQTTTGSHILDDLEQKLKTNSISEPNGGNTKLVVTNMHGPVSFSTPKRLTDKLLKPRRNVIFSPDLFGNRGNNFQACANQDGSDTVNHSLDLFL